MMTTSQKLLSLVTSETSQELLSALMPNLKALVSFMGNKLVSRFTQYDANEARNSLKDLEEMSQMLEAISTGAEKPDLKGDEAARYWASRARELAAEATGIVQKYTGKVRASSEPITTTDLHDLGEEIIKLKAKANEFQCNMAALFIRERGNNLQDEGLYDMVENMVKDNASNGSDIQELGNPLLEEHTMQVLFRNDADVIGFEDHKKELLNWLKDDRTRRAVIAIVAMAGRGKTTLARQVYSSARNEEFPIRVWLTLSPNHIGRKDGLRNLLLEIARRIGPGDREDLSSMDDIGLREYVNGRLRDARYLVVLDNAWEPNVWKMVYSYLPESNNGSRVIITSRCENVAPRGSVFKLGELGPEHSWELFRREAFLEIGVDTSLKKVAEGIVGECHGLPLELVLLGRLLAKKEQSAVAWQHAVERYRRGEEEEARIFLDLIRLSYTHLPDYLLPFFLYLAAFPSGCLIEAERLIQLYVAEGFVGNNKEETARMFLRELEQRGLLEIVQRPLPPVSHGVHRYPLDDRAAFCRVHYRLHDIAKVEAASKGFLHTEANMSAPGTVAKRVALHGNAAFDLEKRTGASLESILDLRKRNPVSFQTFVSLKILELEGTQVRSLPEEIGELVSLLYLGLRDSKVAILPESIGRLANLLTLDARNSYVVEVPEGVWNIKTLRHLYCRCHPSFDGEADLTNLQTMDGARIGPWVESALPFLPNLLTLRLFGTPNWNGLHSGLPSSLVEVRLFDARVCSTVWKLLQSLPSLEILHLVSCSTRDVEITCPAGSFPRLAVLVFMDLIDFNSWKVEEDAMPSVKTVSLVRCTHLAMLPEELRNIHAEELNCVGMSEGFLQSIETARSLGLSRRGKPSEIHITSSEACSPEAKIYKIVSMLRDALVSLPLRNGDIERIDRLREVNDEVQMTMADVRDAEHALCWRTKGDQWAEICVRKTKAVDAICSRCRDLVGDRASKSLPTDLQDIVEELKIVIRGLGLPWQPYV